MNVLLISPGALVVPASKGGAVEKLIEAYINYNELHYMADFTLFTVKDSIDYNLKYKHTKFEYIDNTTIMYKIEKAIRYIINNKLPKIHIGNVFIHNVIKKLKKDNTKYDAIIVENLPHYVLQLRKLYPNTKIIYHIHNDYLNCKTKKAKKILDSYDKIIAISEYISNCIQTIESTDKIEIVYNGIDINKFSKEPLNERMKYYKQKYDIRSEDIVFLYTGRIIPEKGVKELVLAFCSMLEKKDNINNLKLIICRK